MHILIVDDEPLALTRLQRLLVTLGYTRITQASNGDEALRISAKKSFDIAFLDIAMPDMDGIELGYSLRYQHDKMALIYQSAYEHYALKAFDVGAVDYLLKPYTAEAVERSIERALAKESSKELRLISKAGETHYLLSPKDILYVKADLSEVMLRTREGFSYYPKKISDVEEMLKLHGFLRVHRSYLINLNQIKEMNTVDQSRLSFIFEGISETIISSKDGAKHFRDLFKGKV